VVGSRDVDLPVVRYLQFYCSVFSMALTIVGAHVFAIDCTGEVSCYIGRPMAVVI
jgi:hypothetical protein